MSTEHPGAARPDEDDMFTPSLTAADDAVGFDRPWSPGWLVFIGALFGLVPGGMLLAENFRRLGRPAAYMPTLVGTLALGLALTALGAYMNEFGWPGLYEAGNREHRRAFRLTAQGVAIVVGLAIASRQRPRWEIHKGHGGESAPLFKPALGVIALAIILQLVVALPFTVMARAQVSP